MTLTSCDLFTTGLGDRVDTGTPLVGIESHGNGEYVGGVITLSGYATDDLGVENVTLSHGSESFTADLSGESWSLLLDTGQFNDGDLELTVRASDGSGKSASATVLLIVDNSPPSVMVTTPTEYNDYGDPADPADDVIVSFNKSITIKGEAADTTRVRKVYISLYEEDGTVVPAVDHAEATGTSSWYYIFDSTLFHGDADPAAIYYFVVSAEDYSGNLSSFFYHFDDVLGSYPSNTPNIEEINASDNEGATIAGLSSLRLSTSDPRMEITIDPDSDAPRFTIISPAEDATAPSDNIFSSPQRFSGFVEDDDLAGIDVSTLKLTITDWNTSAEVMTAQYGVEADFTLSGNQWNFEASLIDGEYGIELEVADMGGKIGTTSPVPFKVSSFAPVVSVDSPQQGVYIGKGSTTSFTVNVIGASGDEVYIDLDDSGTYEGDEKMGGTGGTYTMDVTEGAGIFDLSADGDGIFQIRAGVSPNFGTATLQYTGDITDPTVDFSYPAEGQSVNGLINISGTAADNYVIGEVYVLITQESDWSALSADYANDWTIPTGTYNWTISSYDTTTLSDGGTYYIYIKAFDDAGNGSDLSLPDSSVSLTIAQESDRPVIELSNMVEGGSGNGLAQDAGIIGIIRDDDKVDASSLEVRVDIGNDGIFDGVDLTEDGDTFDANESELWVPVIPGADGGDDAAILSWSYSLVNVPQGTHSMQIRVHDTVSDGVTNDEGTNRNYAELDVTEFIIDYGPPTLSITAPANGAIFNSSFTIEGTASDANNVTDVEISFNGGTTYESLYADGTGQEVVNWTYPFTVNSNGSTDGDYSYQIRATDYSGGVTTRDRQFIVDATAPSITFEQPPELKTVNGTHVDIKGTADDNRSIAALYISIDQEGTDPAADVTTWDTVDSGIYSWSHSMDSTAYNNTDTAVNYVISLAAVDTAGNATGYLDNQRTVVVDQSSDRPVISFNDIDKDETSAANNVLVGANTLSGIIEDDDSIDPALFSGNSIEISLDGGAWEAVSHPPSASGKLVAWRHDISSYGEGAHTVRIRARDSLSVGTAGDSSISAEYSADFNWAIEDSSDQGGIPFILNVGPPTVTVDNPAPYSFHNSAVTIDGSAVDANGVSNVDISFNNGTDWTALSITAGTSVSWSYTLPVNSDGSDDDSYSYLVRGTDDYGSTSLANGQFTVDTAGPVMSINTPGTDETVNGTISLSGTSTESNGINQVFVGLDGNGDGDVADPEDMNWTAALGTYAWSYSLDTTALGDGSYDLYVRGLDRAGNYSAADGTRGFSVDQSSDKPVIYLSTLTVGGSATANLLPGSLQMSGTVTDDDGVDASSIQIRVDEDQDGDLTDETWNYISGLPSNDTNVVTWNHTFSGLTDGEYSFDMRVGDKYFAGNYNDPYKAGAIGTVDFSVDTALPAGTITFPGQGAYINDDVTLYGTASDASGIKSVEISLNGGAAVLASGTESWSYDYAVGSDGQVSYQIIITDNFDKIYTIDRYFTVDRTAPVPQFTQPGKVIKSTAPLLSAERHRKRIWCPPFIFRWLRTLTRPTPTRFPIPLLIWQHRPTLKFLPTGPIWTGPL